MADKKKFQSIADWEKSYWETKAKYDGLASAAGKGGSFGNEEVKRAIAAGYSMDDVNGYLKFSGIRPSGDFAVGGFKENTGSSQNHPNVGGTRTDTTKTPYYRYTGSAPAAPVQQPTPKKEPDPAPPPPTDTKPPTPVNPELAIPDPNEMNPGDSIRLVGENLGIRAKRSSAQMSNLTKKGTGRLTIPRSSGYQPLNMGM